MALLIVFLKYASRVIPIVVQVGTAFSRFIAKNPKITGGTISVQAISAAIQSHEATEKEKIEIVNEIGKGNPQLREDLFKNIFYSNANIMSNILPYLFIFLIAYYFLKR